jgi:hypothetical protein
MRSTDQVRVRSVCQSGPWSALRHPWSPSASGVPTTTAERPSQPGRRQISARTQATKSVDSSYLWMPDHLGDHAYPCSDSAVPPRETLSPDQVQPELNEACMSRTRLRGDAICREGIGRHRSLLVDHIAATLPLTKLRHEIRGKIASGILMTKYAPGEDASLVCETTSMRVTSARNKVTLRCFTSIWRMGAAAPHQAECRLASRSFDHLCSCGLSFMVSATLRFRNSPLTAPAIRVCSRLSAQGPS